MFENQNNVEGTPEESGVGSEFTPQPESTEMPTPEPPASEKSYGPIVGIIIIVILLILAGFYFWGGSLADDADGLLQDNTEEVVDVVGTEVGAPLSESDAIEDIEAELDGTNLDDLDAELENIDRELTF